LLASVDRSMSRSLSQCPTIDRTPSCIWILGTVPRPALRLRGASEARSISHPYSMSSRNDISKLIGPGRPSSAPITASSYELALCRSGTYPLSSPPRFHALFWKIQFDGAASREKRQGNRRRFDFPHPRRVLASVIHKHNRFLPRKDRHSGHLNMGTSQCSPAFRLRRKNPPYSISEALGDAPSPGSAHMSSKLVSPFSFTTNVARKLGLRVKRRGRFAAGAPLG
jgi:hypothetical protein